MSTLADVESEKKLHGPWGVWKSLYLLLSFSVILELPKRVKSLKVKIKF